MYNSIRIICILYCGNEYSMTYILESTDRYLYNVQEIRHCSMKHSLRSTFKTAVFSLEVSCGFSFPLREVWRDEWSAEGREIIISSGSFQNLSCPSLTTPPRLSPQHSNTILTISSPCWRILNCESLFFLGMTASVKCIGGENVVVNLCSTCQVQSFLPNI